MIKHCQKFHFRIFRHGFLIFKHVRAGRHGILAPALKAETSIYQFLLFDCRRVGVSARWFVGELSSYPQTPSHTPPPSAPHCEKDVLWPHGSNKKNLGPRKTSRFAYGPLINPPPSLSKISYKYNYMLTYIPVSFLFSFIFRVRARLFGSG